MVTFKTTQSGQLILYELAGGGAEYIAQISAVSAFLAADCQDGISNDHRQTLANMLTQMLPAESQIKTEEA